MGSEYPSLVLGEVAEIIMGQSPPGTTYNETGKGLPFYQGVTDFGSRYPSRRVFCTSPTRIAKQGDILLSVRAPIGQVNVASEECAIGRGLAIIRPHNPQDRIFIEFVLRAKHSVWHTLEGGGSVFGNAKRNDLESLEIVWPEEKIRYSVSLILGALDDKIELNHQMNRTLEEMAQAIFKRWFVDFEFLNDEGLPYRSSGGELVYSEELQKEIPKGWEVKPFSEFISVNPKRKLKKGVFAKKVGMPDLNPWQSCIESWQIEEYKSGSKFQNGDILFARITPSLEHGKTALVTFLDDGEVAFGTTEFIVFAPRIIQSTVYIFCLARSETVRETAIGEMTGSSGRQRVPNDCFDHLSICVPPKPIIDEFNRGL